MYAIDLIRRISGSNEVEVLIGTEPDRETAEDAIATGHRVFNSHGTDKAKADGFRVTHRESGKIVCTWFADA
jgi:hypothetical protein